MSLCWVLPDTTVTSRTWASGKCHALPASCRSKGMLLIWGISIQPILQSWANTWNHWKSPFWCGHPCAFCLYILCFLLATMSQFMHACLFPTFQHELLQTWLYLLSVCVLRAMQKLLEGACCGRNCVASEKTGWHFDSKYHRMWLHLAININANHMKKRALGWSLIQYAWCPYKSGRFAPPRTVVFTCEYEGRGRTGISLS